VLQAIVVMRSNILYGEYLEGSFQGNKMSKVLMKLRLQNKINRQIQRDNYELIMKFQDLEEENQRL
jgi:hypothetical protein